MANVITKFLAMGYSIEANTPVADTKAQASEETTVEENPVSTNEIEQENILPINNQVIKTIDFQPKIGGLRI